MSPPARNLAAVESGPLARTGPPAPADPLAGADPAAIAAIALAISGQLTALASGMQAAATALPSQTSGWQGPAQQLASTLLASQPERFQAIAVACAGAPAALAEHADRLGSAAWLRQQAVASPPFLAGQLEQRAAQLADESARQAAGTVLALARSAPARPNRLHRWLGRLDSWRSEFDLGAAQATEQAAGILLQVSSRIYAPPSPAELRDLGSQLTDAGRHPLQTAKTAIDWDTWRTNPPRAAGHLMPDLLTAAAGGGAAMTSRTAETLRRSQIAIDTAAGRDALRREATAASAGRARQSLIDQAVQVADQPDATPWLGADGTRLTAAQNATATAFHELTSAREPAITASLRAVSQTTKAELAGLKYRVKEVDSLKRKLATQGGSGRRLLPALLVKANDAVRYTVVIDDADYVQGVQRVAAQLEREGFHHLSPPHNAWHSSRYRGINTSWLDPDGGAAFEVQFHTPASWRATVETHAMYEESRLPRTLPDRKAELRARIAEAYRSAAIPDGVERLSGSNLLPPSPPDPIITPPDRTLPAGLTSGLAAILAETGGGRAAQHTDSSQHTELGCGR